LRPSKVAEAWPNQGRYEPLVDLQRSILRHSTLPSNSFLAR
jgi:hypothetical protein